MVIGLTGKYCAGKNEVAEFISAFGFYIVDEDKIGHEALEAVSGTLISMFGNLITDSDGRISRPRLGRLVFADDRSLERLESVVHPWMVEATRDRLRNRAQPNAVVNAALLFKMGLHALCDFVMIVRAPAIQRLYRGIKRDETSLNAALRRMCSQRLLNSAPEDVDIINIWNIGSRQRLEMRTFAALARRGLIQGD